MGGQCASLCSSGDRVLHSLTHDDVPIGKGELQQTEEFLQKVPLFRLLPVDQLPILAEVFEEVEFVCNAKIIRQGERGNAFFVIKNGVASVEVESKDKPTEKVATLRPGDYFGEQALLHDQLRMATIIAETDIFCLKLSREKFEELGLHEKLTFAKRKAVVGGTNRHVETRPPSPKTVAERTLMREALRNNSNLNVMVTLDDARIDQIVDVAWKEDVAQGKELITQGDNNADYFYIVQEGSFTVHVSRRSVEDMLAQQIIVERGGSFGELALLYYTPRAATVRAAIRSVVWVIDRTNFKNILLRANEEKAKSYTAYLDHVPLLAPLLAAEREAVAKALLESSFSKDDVIFEQGSQGNHFYILVEGEVAVMKDGKEVKRIAAAPGKANFFGERALLKDEPRAATLKVTSSAAKALALDRDGFNLLLGPLEDIINRDVGSSSSLRSYALNTDTLARTHEKILQEDLRTIALLGCGGFGAVELVEHCKTGNTYAMKMLSKGYVVQSGNQVNVMSEKVIQWQCNSPFIIKLYECYNGAQSLYFLLECAIGGEVYSTYNKKGFHGSLKHAMFYIAGTIFAFEHLHSKKIIYRDLKPENLLITDKGFVKLTDMGLAKISVGQTFTTCGTPDYFAPEIISSSGHTFSVDWWALGILLFELMTGKPPFQADSPVATYGLINKGINRVVFPQNVAGVTEDLVKSLLEKEPSNRLPMKTGGVSNLKNHRWFGGFDWNAMKKIKMPAPYVPQLKDLKDPTNFFASMDDMPPQVHYVDDYSGWDKDFAT